MLKKKTRVPLIDKSELAIKPAGHVVEPREGMSNEHLRWIRKQPCCIKGQQAQAHHLLRVPISLGGNRGMSQTNPDIFTVPLVAKLHIYELHKDNDEKGFFERYGILDSVELALSYARRSPDRNIRSLAIEITGKKRQLDKSEAAPEADQVVRTADGLEGS